MLTYSEALKGIERAFAYGLNINLKDFEDDTALNEMGLDVLLMRELEYHIQVEFDINEDINECLYSDSKISDIANSIMEIINKPNNVSNIKDSDDNDKSIDADLIFLIILSLVSFVSFMFLMLYIPMLM